MNTLQQQFDLISSDLARYGHITAAMESGNAVDLSAIRGEYTDIYHRYVTCQPHLFKRKALSVGTEGALAVAGAALLLGILVKIGAWIANAFFGGSSGGGGGGGGGNAPIRKLEKTIKDGDLLKRIQELCKALEHGKPVAVSEDDVKRLDSRKAYILSGKKPELLKELVNKTLATNKEAEQANHKVEAVFNLFRANANKPDVQIKEDPKFKELAAIQIEQAEKWKVPSECVSQLKLFYETATNVSCKGLTIQAMAKHLLQAAELLLDKRMLPLLSYVILLQEGIEADKKRIKAIESKGENITPVEQAELEFTKKSTRISQLFFQSTYEMYKFASESLKESGNWLVECATKNKDAFSESELGDIKEKAAELKEVNILLVVRDN